jgi:predicted ATPase/class 3 adenylate cyclase
MLAPGAPPTGTVTFLFSDIEGSTHLVQRFGPDWPALLERHRTALRSAFAAHSGFEQGTEGDSFFVVFASAQDAVAAAATGQRSLAAIDWPIDGRIAVRIGLHTGEGTRSDGDYVGVDVHRAARIGAAGHGGQVLLSSSTAALVQAGLPSGLTLRDLGEHRLKDLPRQEHLFELVIDGLPSAFPPLRTLGGPSLDMPAPLSSLVGRDADLDATQRLLAQARLVTVTGSGGTGKTRLIQEVARLEAGSFSGGATFVPLESLRDADLIPGAILHALHLDTATSTPSRDRVVDYFAQRQALLVLDNLEQLDGAGAVIRDLLGVAPGLKVLASSQAALHVAGEQQFQLRPLASDAAIELFLERARAVRPDFEPDSESREAIAAICERLDGLPFAIELAAAQIRLLTPRAILARIGERLDSLTTRAPDLPERQRTLRAAVSWSYDLLPEPERVLLRRFSAFVGGARLEEIEAIESLREAANDPITMLGELVDRSLIVVRRGADGENRYVMPETIRAYARELLGEAGEEATALGDHAAVFGALAARSEPELYGPNRRARLDQLAEDQDNLRAALDHLESRGDLAAALDMCADLWRFWQSRGHLMEGRSRLARLLLAAEHPDASPVPLVILSRAEEAAGSVEYWLRMRRSEDIERHYRRSLELARAAGDRDREAWALYNLAFLYDFLSFARAEQPDVEVATQMRSQALALFREVGDRRGIAESLWAMGANPIVMVRDPVAARRQLQEALPLLEELGNSYARSWALMSVGFSHAVQNSVDVARTWILRAAELFVRDGDVAGQIVAVQALGSLAARAGDDELAVRLASAAESEGRRIGIDLPEIPPLVEPIAAASSRLGQAVLERERTAGTVLELGPILAEALAARAQ